MKKGLEVRDLRRLVGDFELRADFDVAAGERVVILGRSGSGKSSLLRTIAGLESADESVGSLRLGDTDLRQLPTERREIGFIFQEPVLFPTLSVAENAAFGLRVRGYREADRRAEVAPWLDRLGLSGLANRPVGNLSGGEKQRVAFVRALVWKPRLLLLDEPFSALDPALRETLRDELRALHALWPVPLLLVTHDEADASLAHTRIFFQSEDNLGDGKGRVHRFVRNDAVV